MAPRAKETETEASPAALEAAAPAQEKPAEAPTDLIVERWFGDHAIPNYFIAAKEDLKRRLRQES